MHMTSPFHLTVENKLRQIVLMPQHHARWLNTLSYLENCGARKIAICEHPTEVHYEMLKHAAEEFRHAYYLKRQLEKIGGENLTTYQLQNILGGFHALRYLDRLEIGICKILKRDFALTKSTMHHTAYLLITYAIEKRASFLYPLYQNILLQTGSKISVRSIIAEEDQHLADIEKTLHGIENNHSLKIAACAQEESLFENLISHLCNKL